MAAIRVGLDSVKVLLTDVGKNWFLKAYPEFIIYKDKAFDLMSLGEEFMDVTCLMGIPYRFPIYIDGKITFQMADQEEEKQG